jgi:hypothetical protein
VRGVAGTSQGGAIQRTIKNQVVKFRTFAPVVLAGIGTDPRRPGKYLMVA